jgi:hypothetical protein
MDSERKEIQLWLKEKYEITFLDVSLNLTQDSLDKRVKATEGKMKLLLFANLPLALRPRCNNPECTNPHNLLVIYNAHREYLDEMTLEHFRTKVGLLITVQQLAQKSRKGSVASLDTKLQGVGITEFSDITEFLFRDNEVEQLRKFSIDKPELAMYGLCPPYLFEEFLPSYRKLNPIQKAGDQKESVTLTEEEKKQDMYFVIYSGKYLPFFVGDQVNSKTEKDIQNFIKLRQVRTVKTKPGHILKCPCCRNPVESVVSAPLDLIQEKLGKDVQVGSQLRIDGESYKICSRETALELGADI